MSTSQLKIAGAGAFFLLIFLSGFWVSHSGRPFNPIILTIHKLISLAAGICLGITIYQINQVTKLSSLELIASIVSGVFFVGTILTGGLSSIEKPMPAAVLKLHQIFPYLTVFSSAATIYLLLIVRSEIPKQVN